MPKHEMCGMCTKKLMWIFSLYAKAPIICVLSAYVLERDMVFQKAFGHFIMRAVAMPPDDSLCFALNVPILDIWSSERLKLTEIGQFERNSKCKQNECENIYDMVKSFKFYMVTCLAKIWGLAWVTELQMMHLLNVTAHCTSIKLRTIIWSLEYFVPHGG